MHLALTTGLLCALAVLPSVGLAVVAPSLLWPFAVGVVSWAAAVTIKHSLALRQATRGMMRRGLMGAAAWGLASGLFELGAFLLVLTAGFISTTPAAGFAAGLGAGSVEVVYLVIVGAIENQRNPNPERYQRWLVAAQRSHWVAHMGWVERFSALVLHSATRTAVVVSVIDADPIPLVLALLAFMLVDGGATYGVAREWDWFDPIVCRRFFLMLLGVGAAVWAMLLAAYL